MEDRYRRMWLLYRERMARRAGEAASTEKKEMYDWVLEETARSVIQQIKETILRLPTKEQKGDADHG